MSVSFIASTVIHLAVFLLLVWSGRLFPVNRPTEETYYVDVVNLPVASPQAGNPAQKGNQAEPAPPPPSAPAMPMNLPKASKAAPAATAKPSPHATADSDSSDSVLAERMAQLERNLEARQQEAALERLSKKIKATGSGRAGMPTASGTQAGSDYTAYIQSRLKDAFRETISYSSKSPDMIVRLLIDGSGRLTRRSVERSSGDKAFELSVQRAVDMASEKFPPPPDKKVYEGVFVFKPQGISPTRSR